GRTDLLAEGQINVAGIRPGVNGLWGLTKVTSKIDDAGFVVSFESEVPKK
ncbi:MAG: phage late control D family protein, partial [Desulfobacteraceae bacterium]|nr:phage late control D family protein [Desulfobacteraceae bacterium]MCP3944541.1 phage late control D family protein [Desulfobacteraceae bacterium]